MSYRGNKLYIKKAPEAQGLCGVDETECETCSVRDRALFGTVSGEEVKSVHKYRDKQCSFKAGDVLCREKEKVEFSFTLQKGCLILYNNLINGNRQILQVALPGDFIGIQRDSGGATTYSIQAVTDVKLCAFSNDAMRKMVHEQEDIVTRLIDLQAHNLVLYQQRMLNLGQKTARERVAYLIMELHTRVTAQMENSIDPETGFVFFPMTQSDMGDATGLTKVHINRIMMALKSENLIECGHRKIKILGPEKLSEIAEFDEALVRKPFRNFA